MRPCFGSWFIFNYGGVKLYKPESLFLVDDFLEFGLFVERTLVSAESLSGDLNGFLCAFGVVCSQHVHESFFVGSEANDLTNHIPDEGDTVALVLSVLDSLIWLARSGDASSVSPDEVAGLPHIYFINNTYFKNSRQDEIGSRASPLSSTLPARHSSRITSRRRTQNCQ